MGKERTMKQRKGSTLTTALVVLGLLVVGAGAWYFTSDVFRTRVNAGYEQATKWTPEQIAKDPVMYLTYVEAETNKALEGLKANEIAVAQNKAKLQSMRDDAAHKVDVGRKAMAELLGTYKSAEATSTWPISYNGDKRDKDWVKLNVVSLNKQVNSQQNLVDKVDAGIKSLDNQTTKIAEARANAQAQLAEIQANRELLKVQKLTDDLKSKLVGMQSVVQATVGAAADTKGVISLDQLAAESAAKADDTQFDKILAGTK
jgi:hypothetical protein